MVKQSQLDEVYHFIEDFIDDNGYAPSVREICNKMGFKSTATAYNYINRMRECGMLQKADNKKRAVSLPQNNGKKIPLLGTVAAGTPIFATENYEDYYAFPPDQFKGDQLFMLRVQGDSMIEADIQDGDKIVVRRQQTAENGEIVVALIDDGATVKRFFKRNGKIILHPENPRLDDFVLDDVQILGKVIGLVRNM
jgi:repressor LexA